MASADCLPMSELAKEKAWYAFQSDREHGPFTSDELIQLLRSGELPPHTLIWRTGFPDWIEAREVDELTSAQSFAHGSKPSTPRHVIAPTLKPHRNQYQHRDRRSQGTKATADPTRTSSSGPPANTKAKTTVASDSKAETLLAPSMPSDQASSEQPVGSENDPGTENLDDQNIRKIIERIYGQEHQEPDVRMENKPSSEDEGDGLDKAFAQPATPAKSQDHIKTPKQAPAKIKRSRPTAQQHAPRDNTKLNAPGVEREKKGPAPKRPSQSASRRPKSRKKLNRQTSRKKRISNQPTGRSSRTASTLLISCLFMLVAAFGAAVVSFGPDFLAYLNEPGEQGGDPVANRKTALPPDILLDLTKSLTLSGPPSLTNSQAALATAKSELAKHADTIWTRVSPSMVRILAFGDDPIPRQIGMGFYYKDNLVATNYHIVANAKSLALENVKQRDVSRDVRIRAVSEELNVALLETGRPGKPLPHAQLGLQRVGDPILIFGDPSWTALSKVAGAISGVRAIGATNIFEISSPLSPGRSGGPVFDKRGNVLGIAAFQPGVSTKSHTAISTGILKSLENKERTARRVKTASDYDYVRGVVSIRSYAKRRGDSSEEVLIENISNDTIENVLFVIVYRNAKGRIFNSKLLRMQGPIASRSEHRQHYTPPKTIWNQHYDRFNPVLNESFRVDIWPLDFEYAEEKSNQKPTPKT